MSRQTGISGILVVLALISVGCIATSSEPRSIEATHDEKETPQPTTFAPAAVTHTQTVEHLTNMPQASPTQMVSFKLPQEETYGWLVYENPAGPILIRFAPDGTLLAGSHNNGSIIFWDMQTGAQTRVLKYRSETYENVIQDFEFSPDGKRLVVVVNGRIDVWDIAAETFQSLTADHGSYNDVAFSSDGSRLAAGPVYEPPATTSSVEIWETRGWKHERTLEDANPPYVFAPNGAILASLSGVSLMVSMDDPGPPILWDVTTGARHELVVEGFPINIAYSPDGTILAINTLPITSESGGVTGQDTTLLVNVVTGIIQRTIPPTGSGPASLAFSPDGSTMATLDSNRHLVDGWS